MNPGKCPTVSFTCYCVHTASLLFAKAVLRYGKILCSQRFAFVRKSRSSLRQNLCAHNALLLFAKAVLRYGKIFVLTTLCFCSQKPFFVTAKSLCSHRFAFVRKSRSSLRQNLCAHNALLLFAKAVLRYGKIFVLTTLCFCSQKPFFVTAKSLCSHRFAFVRKSRSSLRQNLCAHNALLLFAKAVLRYGKIFVLTTLCFCSQKPFFVTAKSCARNASLLFAKAVLRDGKILCSHRFAFVRKSRSS
ncbi:hypothetical protein [Sporosarcina sp. HYO08]|uniref:hypothetical protein n=1 Tax=Sporosarcina sp. HYO08 TaxID=1759557 RepID=UPI0012E381F4|nr:hypothetical protein [Sporosarcina sp. HYO08]